MSVYLDKETKEMKKQIKIQVKKRYHGREWIQRFMHLLNLIAPGKYRLDTTCLLASIEDLNTGLTVATFNDNPFRI